MELRGISKGLIWSLTLFLILRKDSSYQGENQNFLNCEEHKIKAEKNMITISS